MASVVTSLALAGGIPAVAGAQQQAAAAPSLVFDGVTIVDVEQGKLIPAQRVVIVGNRIKAVGDIGAVKTPKGAQVVNARGKYLIPGLWDMHVHPTWGEPDHFNHLFIGNGVTGIRDAWSFLPLQTQIEMRQEILVGTRIGPPRQILSGPAIDDQSMPGIDQAECTSSRSRLTGHICVATGDSVDARHLVNLLKSTGADMLKMYYLVPEMYSLIAAEARRQGVRFGGHSNGAGGKVTVIDASNHGASIIDHVVHCEDLDPDHAGVEKCPETAALLKKNGTWVVPAMVVGPGFGANSRAVGTQLTKRSHEFWVDSLPPGNWLRDSADASHASSGSRRDSLGSLALMERADVPILAGTDVHDEPDRPAGFALHAELAMMVGDGLTPWAALRSATLNPAKLLHGTDSLGTVAAGKLADLVLLDADPLADITNTTTIRAVVANGRYFDRAALDQLMSDVRNKAKAEP